MRNKKAAFRSRPISPDSYPSRVRYRLTRNNKCNAYKLEIWEHRISIEASSIWNDIVQLSFCYSPYYRKRDLEFAGRVLIHHIPCHKYSVPVFHYYGSSFMMSYMTMGKIDIPIPPKHAPSKDYMLVCRSQRFWVKLPCILPRRLMEITAKMWVKSFRGLIWMRSDFPVSSWDEKTDYVTSCKSTAEGGMAMVCRMYCTIKIWRQVSLEFASEYKYKYIYG